MGASGWSYVVPVAEGPVAAPAGLRDRVLAENDYYWEADYLGAKPSTVRRLSDSAAQEAFGTTTPTRAQFDADADTIPYLHRWSGLYQLLYAEGRPAEVAFWGFSGD